MSRRAQITLQVHGRGVELRRRRGGVAMWALIGLLLMLLVVCLVSRGPAPAAPAGATLSPSPSQASTALSSGQGSTGADLQVAPDGPAAGYEREEFGHGWSATGPGCDMRDTILARDLRDITRVGCDVKAGTLLDPYTGRWLSGPTRELEIDHVVALGLAWRSGAASWTVAQRASFANDPANLMTTSRAANRAKSDAGPEEWLPQHDRCGYATRFRTVVERYGLTVTAARAAALDEACR